MATAKLAGQAARRGVGAAAGMKTRHAPPRLPLRIAVGMAVQGEAAGDHGPDRFEQHTPRRGADNLDQRIEAAIVHAGGPLDVRRARRFRYDDLLAPARAMRRSDFRAGERPAEAGQRLARIIFLRRWSRAWRAQSPRRAVGD
ncbi:MAG TPA: hypothetical protein VFU81_09355 [Thermomicrobiales bacterium]|nr:hypothetical protein [Thermomicrobiales bacterium]